MPYIRTIADLFAKSPFKPLHEHTLKVKECVDGLKPMVDAYLKGNFRDAEKLADAVIKLEADADQIKVNIRQNLPHGVFMPIERSDLLVFLHEQDEIADHAEDVALLLQLRKTKVPEELKVNLIKFVDTVIGAVDKLEVASSEFKDLIETSFGKKELDNAWKLLEEVNRKEGEADQLKVALMRRLFKIEDRFDPVTLFYMMELINRTDGIANHAEDAAGTLRTMLARK